MFDCESFINCVAVKRENNIKLEYEVTSDALKSYLQYPCYKEWKVKKNKLIRKQDAYSLTADIITSIKVPLNNFLKVSGNPRLNGQGCDIAKMVLVGMNNVYYDMLPYLKCFAYVYYWIGNMIPVRCSFYPGRWGADNWRYKMSEILKFYKYSRVEAEDLRKNATGNASQKQLWPDWLINHSDMNKDEFVNENYLMDFFEGSNYDENNLKPFISNKEYSSIMRLKVEVLEADKDNKIAKEWFLNNAKLIIQRSYRIQYKFSGDWNYQKEKEHVENVKSIMQYVFKQAGFTENEIEAENLATIF